MRTLLTSAFVSVLVAGQVGTAFPASAMTLEALCSQDYVGREVLRFSKKLRYPADAKRMKPDIANFDKEAGPMACIFSLTTGNVYDFGNYKATLKDLGYNRVKVISLTPVE